MLPGNGTNPRMRPRLIFISDSFATSRIAGFYRAADYDLLPLPADANVAALISDLPLPPRPDDAVVACLSSPTALLKLPRLPCPILLHTPANQVGDALTHALQALKKRQQTVVPSHPLRYHPGIAKIKEILDSNALGHVTQMKIQATADEGCPLARTSSSPGLAATAFHGLDLVQWLAGCVPENVTVTGSNVVSEEVIHVTFDWSRQHRVVMDISGATQAARGTARSELSVVTIAEHGMLTLNTGMFSGMPGTAAGTRICNHPVRREVAGRTTILSVPPADPVLLEIACVQRFGGLCTVDEEVRLSAAVAQLVPKLA